MLNGLEKLATGQGPLFWGAAAAAALGASLVAAALVLQLRRRPVRAARPARRARLAFPWPRFLRPRRNLALPGLARAVAGGYAPALPGATAARPAAAPDPQAGPELAALLLRLRQASDRLAALQTGLGESGLKGTPVEVDQLYRRGLG